MGPPSSSSSSSSSSISFDMPNKRDWHPRLEIIASHFCFKSIEGSIDQWQHRGCLPDAWEAGKNPQGILDAPASGLRTHLRESNPMTKIIMIKMAPPPPPPPPPTPRPLFIIFFFY